MKIILAILTGVLALRIKQGAKRERGGLSSVAPADDCANRTGWSAFHDPTFSAACVRKVHARRVETNLLTQTRCEDSFSPSVVEDAAVKTTFHISIRTNSRSKKKKKIERSICKILHENLFEMPDKKTITRERKPEIIMRFSKFLIQFCRISRKMCEISKIK